MTENDDPGGLPREALKWAFTAFLQIVILVGIAKLFSFIKDHLPVHGIPEYVSVSLECVRLLIAGIEVLFVIASVVVSAVLFRSASKIQRKLLVEFRNFFIDAATSGFFMLVMLGFASLSGLLNSGLMSGDDSNEGRLFLVATVVLFYLSALVFVICLIITTLNSVQARWRLRG